MSELETQINLPRQKGRRLPTSLKKFATTRCRLNELYPFLIFLITDLILIEQTPEALYEWNEKKEDNTNPMDLVFYI